MSRMNENRNLISMRQRRMIRQLNREIQARKERRSVARKVFDVIMTVCAVILGLLIMVCAAEIRAAEDAQAAVLRRHRITSQNITAQYPHSPNAGLQAKDPYMVESLPAEAPDHGEPPEAIEIKEAKQAEELPAEPAGHWENLGRHKITHYCPERCCNGENAWETASGAPMTFGRTVAASAREFPFGTKLRIDGKEYTVEDRGVGPGCIDILVPTHKEGRQRGRFYTDVYVWRED